MVPLLSVLHQQTILKLFRFLHQEQTNSKDFCRQFLSQALVPMQIFEWLFRQIYFSQLICI